MTACSFNIFIIFTIYLSFIFHPSHGFEVIQPRNRTVNPDGSVSISCEHTANTNSVIDVRLYGIYRTDKTVLCQKGMINCSNIVMHQENPKKWHFIILNSGSEAMNSTYQCEFTVKKDDLDSTKSGNPTILLPGQKEVVCVRPPPPPNPPPPPPPPPPPLWILIGLLALMFLYSCVITFFYIRLRYNNKDPENSTYVEMRNVPRPRNRPFNINCG
ncbi:protein cappuccino-like isoform X1 [Siniperca chuatsi]|uniref:protein cappuccino-like isoform X1 n=1 Tax=Siniperca chuatsi TaxID=119488 RepID=UPI001CE0EB21|nr:protein cappuccino-like isoform X1 [Siniperca chuatsi]XP_044073803.1 protein cappuccino-like isoform X1 [Siniperca chuatsi]